MSYSNHNRDGIDVETTVNVSWDDIKEAIDFDDMVQNFEPSSDELLKHVDFDDALKFVVEDKQFNSSDTIDAILENDELRERMIQHMPKATPPEVKITIDADLFKTVVVGEIHAVIAGDKVRFKLPQHDEVQQFTCADSGLSLRILQGLALVKE